MTGFSSTAADTSQLALGEEIDGAAGRGSAMTDATAAPASRCRKLRLALMASLALNVLIIGVVAGTLCFSRLGPGHDGPGPQGSGLLGFAHTLPRERADMIRQKLADAKPNYGDPAQGRARRARWRARGAHRRSRSIRPSSRPRSTASSQADAKEKRATVARVRRRRSAS